MRLASESGIPEVNKPELISAQALLQKNRASLTGSASERLQRKARQLGLLLGNLQADGGRHKDIYVYEATPTNKLPFPGLRNRRKPAAGWRKGSLVSIVTTLLASPRHGEHWARHWLDVADYADTHAA